MQPRPTAFRLCTQPGTTPSFNNSIRVPPACPSAGSAAAPTFEPAVTRPGPSCTLVSRPAAAHRLPSPDGEPLKLRLPQPSPGAPSHAPTGGRLTGRPAVPTHPATHPSIPASEAGAIGPRRRSRAPEAAKGSFPPHPHPAPPGRRSSLPGPGQLLAWAGPAPYFPPHRRLRRRRRRRQ